MTSLRAAYRATALAALGAFAVIGLSTLLSWNSWLDGEARSLLSRDLVRLTGDLVELAAEDRPGPRAVEQWERTASRIRVDLEAFGVLGPQAVAGRTLEAGRLLAWSDEAFGLLRRADSAAARSIYRVSLSAVTTNLDSMIHQLDRRYAVEARKEAARRIGANFLASSAGLLLLVIAMESMLSRRIIRPLAKTAGVIRSFADGDRSVRIRLAGIEELDLPASQFNEAADRIENLTVSLEREIKDRTAAEEEVRVQLREKEILLREAHHRIKNNMATISGLLRMQADSIRNPEAVAALQDAMTQVNGMRRLYERMLVSENYGPMQAGQYLGDLVEMACAASAGPVRVSVSKRFDPISLHPRMLVPLGIILNELATNVFKYAFANRSEGSLSVELRDEGETLALIVEDDGPGLPEGFDPETSGGFGFMLVRLLARQVGGTLSMRSENGTRIVVRFKRPS